MGLTHGGPRHERGCLGEVRVAGSPTGHGHCACARAAWLAEPIPRGQARAELLDQLAAWATEQRIYTEADVEIVGVGSFGQPASRASAHLTAAVRAAALIARDVWVEVRLGALGLSKECTPHRPAALVPVTTAVTAGERL